MQAVHFSIGIRSSLMWIFVWWTLMLPKHFQIFLNEKPFCSFSITFSSLPELIITISLLDFLTFETSLLTWHILAPGDNGKSSDKHQSTLTRGISSSCVTYNDKTVFFPITNTSIQGTIWCFTLRKEVICFLKGVYLFSPSNLTYHCMHRTRIVLYFNVTFIYMYITLLDEPIFCTFDIEVFDIVPDSESLIVGWIARKIICILFRNVLNTTSETF